MNLLDQLAEAHIQNAMERGALDDLPGAGQPLPPDEASQVPPELRAGYRLLKNAGYVPPEINQAREIRELTDLLAAAEAGSEQAHKAAPAAFLESALASSRHGRGLLRDAHYHNRVHERLAR